MSVTWTTDALFVTPTWYTRPGDEQFGTMSKGTSVNLYIITFVCVVFVMLTLLVVIFAERRRRQAGEALNMMLQHANECDEVMQEKRPVMTGVKSLDRSSLCDEVYWKDVHPLAVQAILPIAYIKKHSKPSPSPPHPSPQSPSHWLSPRFIWSIDTLPTSPPPLLPQHTYDPYGSPAPATVPHITSTTTNRNRLSRQPKVEQSIITSATPEEYVKKAEAFQVTVLIEMPTPGRSRAGSKRSSKRSSGVGGDEGSSESYASGAGASTSGSNGLVRWGDESPGREYYDDSRTIPPFTLGVARVEQR